REGVTGRPRDALPWTPTRGVLPKRRIPVSTDLWRVLGRPPACDAGEGDLERTDVRGGLMPATTVQPALALDTIATPRLWAFTVAGLIALLVIDFIVRSEERRVGEG